ncbi:hypothetical protein F5878DRAFT_608916 [Lentinula raphanica]|uniref:Uncharacterized protein n=1 Tax=Lentinula raphanica TaxID=153919 RepID=A0AA38PFJ7_9AGAR|nr:hypothetical protein EV360DRAFT_71255 [Lentinula raphanica]KAJ3820116.1 hypothetical protein F5880DRAFT_1002444 [Lentinula raphanica]KAJ3841969.1 hypothetical protein F5878DRAFT_608916 [Lentinula raphanica]
MAPNLSSTRRARLNPPNRQTDEIRFRVSFLDEDQDEEDYSADDEGGMDLESSFDASFDADLSPLQPAYAGIFNMKPAPQSLLFKSDRSISVGTRTRALNYDEKDISEEEDDSDEDISEEHECFPTCFLCRISASIYRTQHPDLYDTSDYEEDDLDDCTTSAPPTHCAPDCISCARERLRAEGFKFPQYQYYDQDDHTNTEDDNDPDAPHFDSQPQHPWNGPESAERDTKNSEECRGLLDDLGLIFTALPPLPSRVSKQAETVTSELSALKEPFPRVFFPPPKISDIDASR